MRNWIVVSILLLLGSRLFGQELNMQVDVVAQKLTTADPKIFQTFRTTVYEFMNNRKWTSDNFQQNERIDCKMQINITEQLGTNTFRATATIQSSRPVFNSTYQSVILNWADKDWVFDYTEYQPIEFNENVFNTNLGSMLAFYAYAIIGLDYESYSLKGGTPHFLKAQAVMNAVPATLGDKAPGWRPFEGQRNRYWLIENLINPKYDAFRQAFYQYHRQGLDVMYDDLKAGRAQVNQALKKLEGMVRSFPSLMIIQIFYTAKGNEFVTMFTKASPNEKNDAYQSLIILDPTHAEKYSVLLKN
ncbi:MAG: DUF4835 family protein [Chitinophagales bacterium]|nr:DUF4835 family protein [Chitinophagales bacterium]